VRDAGPLAVRTVAVVDVVLRLQGLRGRSCSAVFTLYRAPLDPLHSGRALAQCTGRVQDGDEGGWQAYVLLPRKPGRYFVRFDLYDERGLLLGPGKSTRVFAWAGG
jgi:hypothetical protein